MRPLPKGKPRDSADRSGALSTLPGPVHLSPCKTVANVYRRVIKSIDPGAREL